jgi:putative membrane protein insertion efficiency factor
MNIFSRFLIGLVKAYQYFLSPLLGQSCRFYPTCSEYALDVINKHGACKGTYYAIRRLLRCHPWHSGGHDPAP